MTQQQITIVEVGPRDGFQNIAAYIPLETKQRVVDMLVDAGVRHIELTSFVSPKAIPQLKDAKELVASCLHKYPDVNFITLVPNLYGAQCAWEAGIREIAYVISLSKSHNMANINRTHEQSFAELQSIIDAYPDMTINLGLATVFGCPIEGVSRIEDVMAFMRIPVAMGIRNIILADTIGIANPRQVREYIQTIRAEFPQCLLQVHIHDTRNMGMVNTLAAVESGVTHVQAALGGLGGCPFAKGATGNTATEDIVYMLAEMGYATGIDFPRLLAAARYEQSAIQGLYSGHHITILNGD